MRNYNEALGLAFIRHDGFGALMFR